MTTRKPWTDAENTGLVSLYFHMLDAVDAGHTINKAGLIRCARGERPEHYGPGFNGVLANRSRGSIEAKLMNATACHRDLGTPIEQTMDGHGYRALPNYQRALRDAMAAELRRRDNEFVREQLA